jgi:hypothetical protein
MNALTSEKRRIVENGSHGPYYGPMATHKTYFWYSVRGIARSLATVPLLVLACIGFGVVCGLGQLGRGLKWATARLDKRKGEWS